MSLMLAAVWLMLLALNTAVIPATHCQRSHMPCCPASGHEGAHCSAVQCEAQSFQKAENRTIAEAAAWRIESLGQGAEANPKGPGLRELHAGLRCSTSVFRLKDDLRI